MTRSLIVFSLSASFSLAQSPSAQELRDLVNKCAHSSQADFALREDYTYNERETARTMDSSGNVKETHITTREIMRFAGKRVARVTEKDGKPLPAAEAKREQEKVDRAALEASHLTTEERDARFEKQRREAEKQNEWFIYVADAYNLKFLREETLDGRPTVVVEGLPKADYNGKYSSLFHRIKGVLYIDKQLCTLTKLEAEFLDNYSFGLFLAKLDKGTRIEYEQVRVNGEIWLPKYFKYTTSGRELVKSFHESGEILFSGYRKFRTDARVVSTSAPVESR